MYEIKVLDSKQFDEVARSDSRYSYVDSDNMGFADRVKGVAYVRQTHLHELNKYLISHELEELESDESTHEDPNGIRHKKGKKFFKDFLAPALTFGIVQPEAPKRAAAQTFQGGQQTPGDVLTPFGGVGGGPLGQFSVASPASGRLPSSVLGQQDGGGTLNPELLQRLKGFFSGRIPF